MRKYTYSRSFFRPDGEAEQFTAVEFDSFDEAIRVVDKGIRDRKLELGIIDSSTPAGTGIGKLGDNKGNAALVDFTGSPANAPTNGSPSANVPPAAGGV